MTKNIRILGVLGVLWLLPATAHAYIGAGVGSVDLNSANKFGYALSFGGELASNFGLDVQLAGFADTGAVDNYWIQGNGDLTYDFNSFLKTVFDKIELHPFLKGGFTYGALLIKAAAVSGMEASHGPGFNF
ncbi:MAG: hypothetical protein V1798_06905, partial [Pseudomonadota bacterium]